MSVRAGIDGRVLTLTIDRPEARNAIDHATAQALAEGLAGLDARDELSVGVLTGAGGAFSTGMDLKAFLRGEQTVIGERGFAGLCGTPPRKPLIAAVEGWALAGGCEIALSCDLVVAARGARFGLPEVKRGLMAAAGGLLRLPRRVSMGTAMLLALTGDPIDAVEAHRLGLVDVLVDDGAALAAAYGLAARIAANAPLALVASKRAVTTALDHSVAGGFAEQTADAATIAFSADAREGAAAFVEKRAAVWSGR